MQIAPEIEIIFRNEPCKEDCKKIASLLTATGFFHNYEIDVAIELVNERLAKGPDSGYHFVLVEIQGRLAGYSCYGATPCTVSSYDIYWIAVHPDFQNMKIGKRLYDETEQLIQKAQGSRIYVDTSQSEKYLPTRKFYEHVGFQKAALLEDFFAPGDGKIIYCKVLP